MAPKCLRLFMWGYQPHFRLGFEHFMDEVMTALGVSESGVECLLVGARRPGSQNSNEVCIEPEDNKWKVDAFDGLLNLIEEEFDTHHLQRVHYGDAPSMQEKPEIMRRESVQKAVQNMLKRYDDDNEVLSFAGPPAPIDDFFVVPVFQLPTAIFKRYPPLREPIKLDYSTGYPSLIHTAVSQVLEEARDELLRPDPGRNLIGRTKSPEEILRKAGERFMRTPGIAIGDTNFYRIDLFERLNEISSLMYEGQKGTGKIILANPKDVSVSFLVRFAKPVRFREHRWSRKLLQMASSETPLIADSEKIYGLGSVHSNVDPLSSQKIFEIEFLDHYFWHLGCGRRTLLLSRYGIPRLPCLPYSKVRVLDTFRRLFPEARDADVSRFSELCDTAIGQRHGSMLIVASDAESEANRLKEQGTKIEPTPLDAKLYVQVSSVDGAVLIDAHCVCYAVGVILDGAVNSDCTPSRGARYNSGIRYIGTSEKQRLAIIVSDDKTVDVIPLLRPRIGQSELEQTILRLESASSENYCPDANWLDQHRFYLNQEQCNRVNAALKRINEEPIEVGSIRRIWDKFKPDPAFDESYFEEGVISVS